MEQEYTELEIGEYFQDGDEMKNPITGVWEPVPHQWIENHCAYSMVGTIKNYNIRMRRRKIRNAEHQPTGTMPKREG